MTLGVSTLLPALAVESLLFRHENDFLRVTAPRLQFLSGAPLTRLRNGSTVLYLFQVSLSRDSFATVERRSLDRFALSYDLREERFAVTRIGLARESASQLPASAVQAWCVEKLQLPIAGLPRDVDYWVRLDVRAEDTRSPGDSLFDVPPLTWTRLIDLFSKPTRADSPKYTLEAGPVRFNTAGLQR